MYPRKWRKQSEQEFFRHLRLNLQCHQYQSVISILSNNVKVRTCVDKDLTSATCEELSKLKDRTIQDVRNFRFLDTIQENNQVVGRNDIGRVRFQRERLLVLLENKDLRVLSRNGSRVSMPLSDRHRSSRSPCCPKEAP